MIGYYYYVVTIYDQFNVPYLYPGGLARLMPQEYADIELLQQAARDAAIQVHGREPNRIIVTTLSLVGWM